MFMFWPRHKKRGFDYSMPSLHLDGGDLAFPYEAKIEDAATAMARLYGIASISMRAALFDAARRNATEGLRLRNFMYDRVHPNDNGQAIAGHLVTSYLEVAISREKVAMFLPPGLTITTGPRYRKPPSPTRAAAARTTHGTTQPAAPEPGTEPGATASSTSVPSMISMPLLAGRPVLAGQPLPDMAHISGALSAPPSELPPPYFHDNADDQYTSTVVCVRGEEMLAHTLRMEGWRYVVEGSAANPKPGIRTFTPEKQVDLCWRPPGGALERSVAFKLGYLKTYGSEMGRATLTCAGICRYTPTTLSGHAGGKPRRIDPVTGQRRTSLHHVENVILQPALHPTAAEEALAAPAASASVGRAGTNSSGCCIVSIRTLPVRPPSAAESSRTTATFGSPPPSSFKILSFFVGKGAAGTGRLHQQSIIMAGTT